MAEASAGHPFKVTFPAPSIFGHPLTTVVGPERGGYGSLQEFVAHAIEIERGLVADAIAAGARYIQFDFPLYPYLVDPMWIARFESAGHSVDHVLEASLAADVAVLEGSPTTSRPRSTSAAATTARRGCARARSSRSRNASSQLPYDTFLVEWDDLGRDGGFEPIRFLRDGAVMAMGVVSIEGP